MRPMCLEFPNDEACRYLDLQYMLGDSLLVAPIFCESGEVSYYLPDGKWTNLFTNESRAGEKWHREKHGYDTLPLMVKNNTILAMGKCDNTMSLVF